MYTYKDYLHGETHRYQQIEHLYKTIRCPAHDTDKLRNHLEILDIGSVNLDPERQH